MEGVQEQSGSITHHYFIYKLRLQTSRDLEVFIYPDIYIAYSHSGQMLRLSAKRIHFSKEVCLI